MTIEIKIPSPGESINEVIIAEWLKDDGSYVEEDENILEIESEKATLVLTAESAGVLKIEIAVGETVDVGKIVGSIDPQGKPSGSKEPSPAPNEVEVLEAPEKSEPHYAKGVPSPAAQKLSSEKDLDLKSVEGTGKDGRITKQDVSTQFKASSPSSASATAAASKVTPPPPKPTAPPRVIEPGSRTTETKKMSPLRKKIATTLVAVKNETAMLTTFNEVDMTAIMSARKNFQPQFKEKHNIKLGFMSFFTAAVIQSLKLFPSLNSYIIDDSIEYHDYMDIGISVSAPKGLVVPVIRNAEMLSLAELEHQIFELATKARELTLGIDEMTGGTFTVTNGGVFGSLMSTPILNPPQSAILGMHNVVDRPIAVDGKVEIRPMMYVALSYDHRVVDGRESVSFLVNVKKLLENPVGLFLDL
ncbi:MAG: 2-oxoglutarate dehydrogenase complex dihydrolipoyllysine-residue succinyltransferase [Proteobacteria bacterium]|nr:2-oxoglutarate dehydrogenase complex dihydrolipoyllysine-residue succinyltransferase [Pseudomonadota bacterium]